LTEIPFLLIHLQILQW